MGVSRRLLENKLGVCTILSPVTDISRYLQPDLVSARVPVADLQHGVL